MRDEAERSSAVRSGRRADRRDARDRNHDSPFACGGAPVPPRSEAGQELGGQTAYAAEARRAGQMLAGVAAVRGERSEPSNGEAPERWTPTGMRPAGPEGMACASRQKRSNGARCRFGPSVAPPGICGIEPIKAFNSHEN